MVRAKLKHLYLIILLCFVSTVCTASTINSRDTIGKQNLAVVLIDLQGDGKTLDRKLIEKAIFNSEFSIKNFYEQSSNGKVQITGRVFGWYHFKNQADPTQPHCEIEDYKVFESIGKETRLKKYDRYLFLYHFDSENCDLAQGGALGISTFGKQSFNTPQGKITVSLSRADLKNRFVRPAFPFQKLSGITSSVIAHELGHGFGITGHANLYTCKGQSLSADINQCAQSAISDRYSIMGGEGFTRLALDFRAAHKEELGWLDKKYLKILTLDKPFSKKIELPPNGVVKVLLLNPIPLATVQNSGGVYIHALYLENRDTRGFNHRVLDISQNLNLYFKNIVSIPPYYVDQSPIKIDPLGIQIHGVFIKDGKNMTTYLLDSKPQSLTHINEPNYPLYDALDSTFNAGDELQVPLNPVKIKVLSATPNQAVWVEITRN